MMGPSVKLVAAAAVIVAIVSQFGVNGQVRSIDVNNLGQRWGAWGQWSADCRTTFPRCGNAQRRRQRLCYAYQLTGTAIGYQDANIVIETNELGEGVLFFVDNQGRRQQIQTTDSSGRPAAFTPGNLGGCDGSRTEAQSCGFPACQCYSQWTRWGRCLGVCESGTQQRTRTCRSTCSPTECSESLSEQRSCNLGPCASWTNWGQWTGCAVTCGKGRKSRVRECRGAGQCPSGQTVQTANCEDLGPCVGQWSRWGVWGRCDRPCGGGTQSRTRRCPTNNCVGEPGQTRRCNENPCIQYDPQWSSWSQCSVTCGQGFERRSQSCLGSDGRQAALSACGVTNGIERRRCTRECYSWRLWTQWSRCSANCGPGQSTRTRACVSFSGQPVPDTTLCGPEIYEESRECRIRPCYSSAWSRWSTCSVTCGSGTRTRTKICEKFQEGVVDVSFCGGEDGQTESCFARDYCYEYTEWSTYGACTTTCGTGIKRRTRSCRTIGGRQPIVQRNPNQGRTFGLFDRPTRPVTGNRCAQLGYGPAVEQLQCIGDPCYNWAIWGSWSSCDVTCGRGTTTRTRICWANRQTQTNDYTLCGDENSQTRQCQSRPCYRYSEWGEFSACTRTCGSGGTISRRRWCERAPGVRARLNNFCSEFGPNIDTQPCEYQPPCYDLTAWSIWSTCTATCGQKGFRTRSRQCLANNVQTDVIPSPCNAELFDSQPCPSNPCYEYEIWQDWGICSTTCGPGVRRRNRRCLANGAAVPSGNPCRSFGPAFEQESCNNLPCYELTLWTSWSACTETCGTGQRTRSRICKENGVPVQNSIGCGSQDLLELETCVIAPSCHNWNAWQSWSQCSVTCGEGKITRSRYCAHANGQRVADNLCPGRGYFEETCISNDCPMLGVWSEWSACTKTCGRDSSRTRRRSCMSGTTVLEPRYCLGMGPVIENAICNVGSCYAVGEWASWSVCSEPCGNGFRSRSRTCFMDGEVFDLTRLADTALTCGYLTDEINQVENCFVQQCFVWGRWGDWTQCTKSCGPGGSRFRNRVCVDYNGQQVDEARCAGLGPAESNTDIGDCFLGPCYTIGVWGDWGECSVPCGTGTETRQRFCFADGQQLPFEQYSTTGLCGSVEFFQTRECVRPSCYRWGVWKEWSTCSRACGSGERQRDRQCLDFNNNEVAASFCYGIDGVFDESQSEICYNGPCYTIGVWGEWSVCDAPCGLGKETRLRFCFADGQELPFDQYGLTGRCGDQIVEFSESRPCNLRACYYWGEWDEWTECSTPCGPGERHRDRVCFGYAGNAVSASFCVGLEASNEATQRIECSRGPCFTFGAWSDWGVCDVPCGLGTQRRSRACLADGRQIGFDEIYQPDQCGGQSGSLFESRPCQQPACYYWGEWDEWTECSTTCGPGERHRGRVCFGYAGNAVAASFCVGLEASNEATQRITCELSECYFYEQWSEWTTCTKSCGSGQRTSFRSCTTISGKSGEEVRCSQFGRGIKSEVCNTQLCIGQWRAWAQWSSCTAECGGGVATRKRDCSNNNCIGDAVETIVCNSEPCTKYTYSEWGEFSPCSRSCGNGTMVRNRVCLTDKGVVEPDTTLCGTGRLVDVITCVNLLCGVYGQWQAWGACSLSCDSGVRIRRRFCPSGYKCGDGKDKEAEICNDFDCGTVLDLYTPWSAWGACSRSCGGGKREQTRQCRDPTNVNCIGSAGEVSFKRVQDCNVFSCDRSRCVVNPLERIECGINVQTQSVCLGELNCCWTFNQNGRGFCYRERGFIRAQGSGRVTITSGASSASGSFVIDAQGNRIDSGDTTFSSSETTTVIEGDGSQSTFNTAGVLPPSGGSSAGTGFFNAGSSESFERIDIVGGNSRLEGLDTSQQLFDFSTVQAFYYNSSPISVTDDQKRNFRVPRSLIQLVTSCPESNCNNDWSIYTLDCSEINIAAAGVAPVCADPSRVIALQVTCVC